MEFSQSLVVKKTIADENHPLEVLAPSFDAGLKSSPEQTGMRMRYSYQMLHIIIEVCVGTNKKGAWNPSPLF
jgi:hypothetical protein